MLTEGDSIVVQSLEMAIPRRMMATPAIFRTPGRSRRMRKPNRNTQIKLVAVMQGSTVMGTCRKAIWLQNMDKKSSP